MTGPTSFFGRQSPSNSLTGKVSANVVRQANTHPTWVQRELDWDAEADAITFLVSPRQDVDREAVAVAADHVRLSGLNLVRELAREAAQLWLELVPRAQALNSAEATELIARAVESRGLKTKRFGAALASNVYRR